MTDKIIIDSVIVPVNKTIKEILSTNIYKQQIDKPFRKKVDFLVFYANRKILGYGKIAEVHELITHREYYIEKFIEVDIPHLEKGYFIIGRKYTNIEMVHNAKTTKDL